VIPTLLPTFNQRSNLVSHFNKKNKVHLADGFEYLKSHINPDFYLTENNHRVFITNSEVYFKLLKQSTIILFNKEDTMVDGMLLIWKGVSNDTNRNYIKLSAEHPEIARKLLSILLWNYNLDLFIKIKKDSPFLYIFRDRKFIFLGGRGNELLLLKKKETHKYGNYTNKRTNSRQVFNRR